MFYSQWNRMNCSEIEPFKRKGQFEFYGRKHLIKVGQSLTL